MKMLKRILAYILVSSIIIIKVERRNYGNDKKKCSAACHTAGHHARSGVRTLHPRVHADRRERSREAYQEGSPRARKKDMQGEQHQVPPEEP